VILSPFCAEIVIHFMFWKYFPLHEEEARTSLKIALIFVALWLYTKDAISGHLTETAALLTFTRHYITHCIMLLSIYIFVELILTRFAPLRALTPFFMYLVLVVLVLYWWYWWYCQHCLVILVIPLVYHQWHWWYYQWHWWYHQWHW